MEKNKKVATISDQTGKKILQVSEVETIVQNERQGHVLIYAVDPDRIKAIIPYSLIVTLEG